MDDNQKFYLEEEQNIWDTHTDWDDLTRRLSLLYKTKQEKIDFDELWRSINGNKQRRLGKTRPGNG
jgi:hypothetical protein